MPRPIRPAEHCSECKSPSLYRRRVLAHAIYHCSACGHEDWIEAPRLDHLPPVSAKAPEPQVPR